MIHYESERVIIHHGDCLDVLRTLDDNSVDAVVTDPPYGLEFMGKDWDAPWKASSVGRGARVALERSAEATPRGRRHETSAGPYLAAGVDSVRVAGLPFQQWCEQWVAECLRVLKPGGHLLAFGGTRTWHRLACAIEDAGFEIRDNLAWLYGSGFPKSLDVSKAIDKAAGVERKVSVGGSDGALRQPRAMAPGGAPRDAVQTMSTPATPDAARWQGWGTALKPAYEPIILARKPLAGTVAGNVLAHGTGALNVDGCRVGVGGQLKWEQPRDMGYHGGSDAGDVAATASPVGRWPANVVLDETAAAMLDEQSGPAGSNGTSLGKSDGTRSERADMFASRGGHVIGRDGYDTRSDGGASRFFYTAKAGSDERPRNGTTAHPTVKPLDLMRWLVRLVTPPGGTVLEPFAGSGATVEACILEGFRCVAVEREADYLPLIEQRIHRRVDPVAHHVSTRTDDDAPSLFDLIGGDDAA